MAKRGSAAPAPAPSSSSGVQRAHELFKQGRAKEALALLRPLLQRKGDVDANVCALAAACLGAEGDYMEAARIDRLLCNAQPNNPQAWHSLGYDLFHAINNALREEMRRDDRVIVLGEDVGRNGGVFRCTEGLLDEFPDRVFDTPLAEGGIIGTAIGMALYGLRPVPEIQFMDFIYPGFDQIVSEAAKMRYRSGGQFSVPMTIRTPFGGGIRGGHYHSQSTEAYFCHTPGLKVVVPSTPKEAKGLLTSSIRDPDPVLFLEPKKLYRSSREEVPEGEVLVPLGEAAIESLRAPIVRVTGFDTPFPYALEDVYLPNSDRVLAAIDKVMTF